MFLTDINYTFLFTEEEARKIIAKLKVERQIPKLLRDSGFSDYDMYKVLYFIEHEKLPEGIEMSPELTLKAIAVFENYVEELKKMKAT